MQYPFISIFLILFFQAEEKQNLNLDEQPAVEAKEIDALADEDNENLERKKRDVDEPMIDDQRPDDEEIPLQRSNFS